MEDNFKIAVLIVGHGSKQAGANSAMYNVAESLKAGGGYIIVECAFLEINEPSIPVGLDICREAGAGRIVVIPYFLLPGRHVLKDIPLLIADWSKADPSIQIIIGDYLGFSPALVEIVKQNVKGAAFRFE